MLALSVAIKRYIGANGASTLPPPISERKRSKTELQTKMRRSAPSFLVARVSAIISRRHDEACHTETCPHRQHSIAGRVCACQVKHAAAQHIRSQGCQKALGNAVESSISRATKWFGISIILKSIKIKHRLTVENMRLTIQRYQHIPHSKACHQSEALV